MKKVLLSPSILSADFCELGSALNAIKAGGADMVHIDVMDGHFVPQVTYGQPVIKSLRLRSDLPFDVHLMVEKPELSIPSYIEAGADFVTFHIEATSHADLCIQLIHDAGKKAGVAICPATPVSLLKNILPLADMVLVMTVNPGWGGQKLIPYTVEKVAELAELKQKNSYGYMVSVDGGINASTLASAVQGGTDVVVSGSSFFSNSLNWPAGGLF